MPEAAVPIAEAAQALARSSSAIVLTVFFFAQFLAKGGEVKEPGVEAVIIRKKRNPYIPQAGRYRSTDWFANLRSLPTSSLLRRIRGPIVFSGVMAALVCVLHYILAPSGHFRRLGLQAHSLLGSALGLLLVFRTNTAYSRFWEGRVIWEKILDSGRDLSRYAVLFRQQIGRDSAARICRLVQAFPYCMIEHLRGRADKKLRKKLDRLVGDASKGVEGGLPLSTNRPLYIVNRLASTISVVPNEEGAQAMFTNRERCAMLDIVQTLSKTIGACERIVQTPVPLTYVRHTSRFLSLFMFTLPYALIDTFGLTTVAVTMVASWALFGILEIGLMIEDPFQQVLKVEVVADTLERDIFETIRFLGAESLLQSLAVEPLAAQSWAEAALANPMLKTLDQQRHLAQGSKPKESEMKRGAFAKNTASESFPRFDLNSDGVMAFDEFKGTLQRLNSERWTDSRVQQMFEMADANSDGTISFLEWRAIIQSAEDLMQVSAMPPSRPLPADLHDGHDHEEQDDEDGNETILEPADEGAASSSSSERAAGTEKVADAAAALADAKAANDVRLLLLETGPN